MPVLQTGSKKGWQKGIFDDVIVEEWVETAIVTHGGVIRYLLSKLSPRNGDFWEWKVPHGNGFELVMVKQKKLSGG